MSNLVEELREIESRTSAFEDHTLVPTDLLQEAIAHIERLVANQVHFGDAAYVDCECATAQDKRLTAVSGFRAGLAFNELCHMIGGRWPDARMQQEAPRAYALFMELFSGSDDDVTATHGEGE